MRRRVGDQVLEFLYPHDLARDSVLARKGRNAVKFDFLASEEHRGNWVRRNETCGKELGRGGW